MIGPGLAGCVRQAHNAVYVQSAPTEEPAPAGFFAPAGDQTPYPWGTIASARGLSCADLQENRVSLPITARQLAALRVLQQVDPDLGELAAAIALAFDASRIDNPQLARIILQNSCRRIVADQPGSHESMIQHLESFGNLNCLSPAQVTDFTNRIRKMS